MDKNIRVRIIPYRLNEYLMDAYEDTLLGRIVTAGETFWVTEARAKELDNIHVIKIAEIIKKGEIAEDGKKTN